ncbi:GlcG/HbpS family heme-binding protein [Ruania rhizosphaerae]|uniref:GlcG/HbpS family heme-binding protein n=1 Tax=Ruania rhizosphaerae TaxID=1840413 RepID=UPI00135C1EB2|nr:heme-binding protein [Ruania rhizosphaerae]
MSTVSNELANELMDVASARGEELGGRFSIALVDVAGTLKNFRRLDSCPLVGVQVAQDKAYTAVLKGIPTHEWYEGIKDNPSHLYGVPSAVERVTIFGGGFPIHVEGELIGGLGASGGTYLEDMDVVQSAISAVIG